VFVGEIWAEGLVLSNNRLAAERKPLDDARLAAEAALHEAAEMADVVTNDLEAVKAQLQAKEERLAVAATAAANQGEHLAAARATLLESKAGADKFAALLAE